MPAPLRAPWPFDCIWNGVGLMMGAPSKDNPGQLVLTKPADLTQVVPPNFGYDALPPTVEAVHSYDELIGGMGERLNLTTHAGPAAPPTRYFYATNVDTSVGTPWMLGPAITNFTPATTDATNGVSQFFEIGGNLYVLAGQYCLVRASDISWTVSKDFGGGKISTHAISYYYNNGAANRAYVGMGDTEPLWRFTAASTTTVWDQPDANLFARDFAMNGRELWRATATNQVSKCDIDADPAVLANWTVANSFTIGDKQYPIQRLATTIKGNLIIFKTDGVYTIDADGRDNSLYPYLHLATSTDGGRWFGYWLNDIYFGYGQSGLRIKPTMMLGSTLLPVEEIGPERILGNDSPVHGELTASCGHETFNLYQAIWNPDTNTSYILKFGSWNEDPMTGTPTHVEVWHGSICEAIVGKKVTAMYKSTIGAPSGHTRMYLGYSDGSVGYFVLPCTANPAGCTSYVFSSAEGYLYFSAEGLGFRNDPKVLKALTVTPLSVNATNYVKALYKTDQNLAFTTLQDAKAADIVFQTLPNQKEWLPTTTVGIMPQCALLFHGTAGSTPQIASLAMHYVVAMPPVFQYQFEVLADQVMLKRDRMPLRLSQSDIRDLVRNAVGAFPPVTATFADQSVKSMSVIDYQEVQSWSELLHQWSAALRVTAIDFTKKPNYVTVLPSGDAMAMADVVSLPNDSHAVTYVYDNAAALFGLSVFS